MSSIKDDFDPYYTWLGIRPEEQPADHYRLIGVRQFEDNADVISNAADRQMQFLRTLQVGKRSALSQKLLNEVSAAGGCLLDPERKAAYDNELKAKEIAKAKTLKGTRPILKAAPLAASPQPAPLVTPLPEPDLFSLPMPQQAYVAPARPAAQQQQQNTSHLPLILGGAAAGMVLLLLVVIVAGRMFSGGNGTAAKVEKRETETVPKDGKPSAADSKPISPEKAEKAPESAIVKPVSPPDSTKANAWQYGVGAFDEQSKRTIDFLPLRHWTGNAWQMSRELPNPDRGWVLVGAAGGHTGKTQKDSSIRRWIAPQTGKLSISGELKHEHVGDGDGIRGRVVSSRAGVRGEWKVRSSATQTPVSSIDVQAGDYIDFLVDCVDDDTYDYFFWKADLRLTDSQGKELGTWNSEADFHGPLPGQLAATSGSESTKSPVDPNWKLPTADSPAFRSFLGTYMYYLDRQKSYPVVNLRVPNKDLWTPEVQDKARGKAPFEEISYIGRAKIAIPADGTYLLDSDRGTKTFIDGSPISDTSTAKEGKGEVRISKGVHDLSIEVHTHGQPFMQACYISLKHKETGEEVTYFNTWQDIQKFLATPINGERVTEVSGWQPSQENELKNALPSLTASTPKLPRLPRDPKWNPPGDKGQTKFSAFLGTYSHWNDRNKLYPIVNLQVPDKNLWTKEIRQKLQGKIPFEEISYFGTARIYIPTEGVYVVDTHRDARFDVYSQRVSGHGEVKLPRGYQDVRIDVGSHGGPFVEECSLSMHNKVTGEEVQFFSYWEDIQKFLATPIEGQSVTEVSGWQPTEESDLRGPVHWWDFDVTTSETADDVEKRGNMKLATWKAGEPRFVPGKVGNAVRFHRPEHEGGTWSFFDSPHLTVVFWLKALKDDGGNQQILSPWVGLNYGKRSGVGVLGMVMEPQCPELGKWYHYAVAINQETKQVNIYRDGAEVASGGLGNYESKSNSRYWALGHNHDLENHSETLRGELDEMRVYDRLLSQDEVKQVIAIDLARAANAPITLPNIVGPSPSAPNATPTLPAVSATPAKPSLPDSAAVAAARKEVVAIFKDDLKAAKTPKAKQELATKMLGIAKATSDPTEKYATLEEVRKLAEEIKDAALAGTVLDAEGADFGIDALSEKVKLLEKLSGGTMTPVQRGELLSTAMRFGDAALAAGKTESLPGLASVIRSLVGKGITPDRKTEALDFVESLSQRQQDAESLRLAEQKLAKSPDDPEANVIMGLYYCFTIKDDLKGLPLLVKGNNPQLALAAKDRLSVTSTSTLCSLAGASAWSDAAPTVPAEYKWRVQKRALEYYQWLLANSKGPDKLAVQKRHDQLLTDIVSTLKQSELPRSTPGLVGRVQVDGKDAGIVVTSRPPGELREERLAAILAQAKGRRARLVLSATFHCETPGEFRVYHVGREGGPQQVISLDGKPFSSAGGANGSGGEQRGNVGAGDHVLQWSCDFDLSTRPRLDLSFGPTPEDQKRLEVFASQRQLFEAWKLSTKMDITVSEY